VSASEQRPSRLSRNCKPIRAASGGSCLSGAAISDGRMFWGSGYSLFGTPNNKLYSFGL
jgi:hypothetical protein